VVLGIGPGGEHAARKLAEAGLHVIGVDEALVGGECPFWGCTPSKLMVRPADLLAEVRRADRLAGNATVRPDWSLVAARIREANHDWTDGQHVTPLEEAGMQLVRGHGRLAGPGVVRVEGEDGVTELRAARGVLLNTGTQPLRLPIDGLAATPYWTNREVMKVTEVPEHLVVVGAGPNGLELAQVFRRYGAQVTLLESEDRIASHDEPEASTALAANLRDEGIDVRTGVEIERVDHEGQFRLVVDGDELTSDQLLVAAGRDPNLADIGLETVGLDPDGDTVEIDERMRAGERLWAVGDITGKGPFTHVSRYQARTGRAPTTARCRG
jgi:pyruvate/2-oxoglutarate dehydrogenase complex dihydrolipoamide dehydrogenase (E3) component